MLPRDTFSNTNTKRVIAPVIRDNTFIMKQFSMLGILFFFSSALFGQTAIKGKVLDQKSGEPITFAIVNSSLESVISHYNGEFEIHISEGDVVTVSAIGYTTHQFPAASLTSPWRVELAPSVEKLQTIEVVALKAGDNTPIAKTNLSERDLEKEDFAKDMPYILENTASVVTTSDGGTGVGYTGLRIRGSDQARINVTINGVPVNDAESQGVFWVNTPDLASSVSSMQIQRGVGSSTNGGGAFGGSINMETKSLSKEAYGDLNIGGGSFNTQRYTLAFGTGLIHDHWTLDARASRISSDGWVERASSDLKSYYLALGYIHGNTTVKAVVFGGRERTYQAWYGTDSFSYAINPRFNYAGAIYDDNWNVKGYYPNQVDNYGQDYYQLHVNQKINRTWSAGVSGFYTRGKGYYEEYQQWQSFADYGMNPIVAGNDTINSTDLTRRLWLDNHYYGVLANLRGEWDNLTLTVGGAWNQYDGDHYGEFLWAQYASNLTSGDHFYNNNSVKTAWNVYSKGEYQISDKLAAYADLQIRSVKYTGLGVEEGNEAIDFADQLFFFNPKAGLNYNLTNKSRLYASYAMANREPNRKDYVLASADKMPQPERLQDIELGYEGRNSLVKWNVNAFYMFYTNQLVLTGELDDVGYPIRENVGNSYRAGLEISSSCNLLKQLTVRQNLTLSQNKNVNYVRNIGDTLVENMGNTNLTYSPNIIANLNATIHLPLNLNFEIIPRYISKQYLGNENQEQFVLPAYFVTDVRLSGTWSLSNLNRLRAYAMANNVFSEEYASNGYKAGSYLGFYPQAPINYMFGLELSF